MDESLEQRVQRVEARNMGVEADKAWETSWTRRGLIAAFTYVVLSLYMWAIGIVHPWLSALIPTTGFVLSTLTLPYFKKLWLKRRK